MYSATRTLLILLLQYVQIVFIYASIYLILFADSFGKQKLMGQTALEFSMLTMTTVSFGTIVPNAGSAAALVAASQALIGLFFLGVMVSTTLSRTRSVEEIGNG
jgi:hypothetical protein